MRYLLDRNTLSNEHIANAHKHRDFCVLQDVLDEADFNAAETKKLISAGIHILKLQRKHLIKLKEVMGANGDNIALIDLYTGKGMADVAMIAFVLAERESPESLFCEEFALVTNDQELTIVAQSYSISCVQEI